MDADPWLTDEGASCVKGRNCDSCVERAAERFERDFSEAVGRLAVDDSCWIEHVSRGFDAVLGEAS